MKTINLINKKYYLNDKELTADAVNHLLTLHDFEYDLEASGHKYTGKEIKKGLLYIVKKWFKFIK